MQEQEQAEMATTATATATEIAPTGEQKLRKTTLVDGQAAETRAALSSNVSPAEPAATATEYEPTIQAGACVLLSCAARVLSGCRLPQIQALGLTSSDLHMQSTGMVQVDGVMSDKVCAMYQLYSSRVKQIARRSPVHM